MRRSARRRDEVRRQRLALVVHDRRVPAAVVHARLQVRADPGAGARARVPALVRVAEVDRFLLPQPRHLGSG